MTPVRGALLGLAAGAAALMACAGPEPAPSAPATPAVPATTEPRREAPAGASSEGAAYVLVDRPSGQVLDAARAGELDRPVLPGSIAKIALLTAALQSGIVGPRTELMCRRDLVVDGQRLTCSHPDLGRPLSAAEALAHSCNSFFVTTASRVPRDALNAARVALGLPPVGPAGPPVPAALGLAGPTVAPRVLAAALERAVVDAPGLDDPAARAILLDGLRGSATYGTADALADLSGETYAKTGTAPMAGGGSLGLVVVWRPAASVWASRGAGLSLVVLAPGASGRDAAIIARRILEGATPSGVPADAARPHAEPGGGVRVPLELPATLRVGEVDGRGYRSRTIGLEDYVARAVAGEAAPGTPGAALEALAVAVRTYAMANLGRHADEGFDLCDLTHCQALRPATREARAAAAVTSGRILTYRDQPAQTLHSASCGGWSATPGEIWRGASTEPAPYLVSRAEPACREVSRWTAEVSARDLTRALRAAGLRGTVLRDLLVVERTASGRAARVRVEGFEPREISAEEFRLAVGRTLGWNLVKSHLFDLRRVSTGYRLAGFGAGHGVGLCLAGAARLGRAGRDAPEILADYFPGTALTEAGPTRASAPIVRLELPAAEERERAALAALVDRTLDDLQARTGERAPAALTVRFHPTVESFRRATGRDWWVAGATRGDRIDLLPVSVLLARNLLRATLTHELAHVFIDPVLADRPLWVREGVAEVLSGDGAGVVRGADACPADEEILHLQDAETMRDVYRRAAACVQRELDAGRSWRQVGR